MAAFSYTALNSQGKSVKGVLEGDSERHVRSQLRGKHLKPLSVVAASSSRPENGEAKKGSGLGSLGGLFAPKLSIRDRSLLTRQLASLLLSGLPIDEALNTAAKQSGKESTQGIILSIRSRVMEGHSLAQALAQHPASFDNMYRSMVQAGETTGYLGKVLEQLAEYIERSEYTRSKLRMAMVYPLVLIAVSISVVTALMVFVVPDLVGMFQQNDRTLPLATQILIYISDTLTNYGLFILLLLVAIGIGIRWLLTNPAYQRIWHRIVLKLPLIRNIVLLAESSRFAGTLSLLAQSGVPLLQALKISTQVMSNLELKESCSGLVRTVQEGGSLSTALRNVGWFPPLLVQMTASGEANGTLDQQLSYCSKNQERELEMSLSTTLGIFEPMIVVVMGGAIVFIMLAILLPIFDLNKMV